MGAWGIGNFENYSAGDWLYEFGESPTKVFLEKTLETVFEEEYLDSDIASEALSAIEAIALIKGNSKEDEEELEGVDFDALKKDFDKALFDKSTKCINRILEKNNNELYELWEESESFEAWRNVVLDLKNRVYSFQ
ncbi:DUF4259 domain-containing protein [Algibacter lectus]|uniref:DUF4259 domain-containing protein n=1 Tax=Algibacter lectus TaxID=221126 RepID=UPI0026F0A774|nr:DUF4259 domain-containing protein [Algibacter lectus]MDO7135936.1 DUF4259 domain-containing protein [Algibacter lectus]